MLRIKNLFLLLSCLFIHQFATYAQPGSLDPTFGGDGRVTLDVFSSSDEANDIVVQPDGKILVAGRCNLNFTYPFVLVRLNSDGTLDNTFSDDGIATTQFGTNNNSNARRVILQDDGKILVGGTTFTGGAYQLAIARFNSDGTLDNTFSDDGQFVYPTSNSFYVRDMALDNNDNIVVAGSSGILGSGDQITVLRVLSNGILDTDFGSAGVNSAVIGAQSGAFCVTIQTDGKIVVAGNTFDGLYSDFAVARFLSTGQLDTTFDSDGKKTFALEDYDDYATSLLQLPNGKLLLGGIANTEFVLVQLNSNGAFNTTFSGDGIVLTDMNDSFDEIHDLALDADGNIVAVGFSAYNIYDMSVLRYFPDGNLDNLFSLDGKTTVDFSGTYDYAYAADIQPDGRIVIAGSTDNAGNMDIALARLESVCPTLTVTQDITITSGESYTVGTSTYTEQGVYEDILLAESGCDSLVITNLTVLVGVEDIMADEMTLVVWPMPFDHEIIIDGTVLGDRIQILDMTGKVIHEQSTQMFQTRIATSEILPGTYLLSHISKSRTEVARLMKLH